ncbi:MAG: WD40 repeat domain-containing serine/threonine protein kinase, partial [Rudaea sp.]
RMHGSAIADLAFGSLSKTAFGATHRHLALLPAETLELDLSEPAQRQFGDYELLEMIGEGGMGVVYRARQSSLDREVAVKLLAAGPWASKEFIERFHREAQNAARMQHPNIVPIYEVGCAEELHFFSMRLINGPSLAAVIKQEAKLTPRRAATLLRTIAEAVDYAHRMGVLHLDLKPANVLLDENGNPHVADFGLARRLDNALAADNDEISGTPSYMAPEQASARTRKITPATDIWGLGAIGYELVTGSPPFIGDSPQAILKLVLEGELRNPRRDAPQLPRDLEAILLKCMTRDTTERYASARALADDLGRFLNGRIVQARPIGAAQRLWRWAKRQPFIAGLAALLALTLTIGVLGVTSQWRRAEANAASASASSALANHRLWQARVDKAAVAVRDGHAYDALPELALNVKEREAQGLDASEDRMRIGTIERSAPRLIDAIALGSGIYGIALSSDGASVAITTEDEKIRLLDTATGKQYWENKFNGATRNQISPEFKIRLEALRYSPDGRFLIGNLHYGLPTLSPTGLDEILFDARDGKVLMPPTRIVPKFIDATYSPDGTYAVVRTSDQRAALMHTSDWRAVGDFHVIESVSPAWLVTTAGRHVLTTPSGFAALEIRDPRSLTVRQRIQYTTATAITAWASSADGETVAIGHQDGQIELLDCATGKRKAISPGPAGRVGWIAYSPDGQWFGAVADSGQVLVWDSATGKLAAPAMHLNITPEHHHAQLAIDANARTVIASADMEMGLWYLPDAASNPLLLSGEFPNAAAWWVRSFAYSPGQGLVASDGGQGNLLLWRVQPLAPRGLRSAWMPTDPLRVTNGHIVAVDEASMRVVNAADGHPVGPALALPQPPAFAQLTTDNTKLVAIAGHRLFVYDVATWALTHAPIELPDDPAQINLNPDSRHVLLVFGDYRDDKNGEFGQVRDLTNGQIVATAPTFEPLSRFRFSTNGRELLHWKDDRLFRRDALTLRTLWGPLAFGRLAAEQAQGKQGSAAPDLSIAITNAEFSMDGSRIDVLTANADAHDGAARYWELDAATGKRLKHTLLSETGGGEAFAKLPDGKGLIVQRLDSFAPLWIDVHGHSTQLPSYGNYELGPLALSPNATQFARAPSADHIAITSTDDRQWLSPLMPTALPMADPFSQHPTQLAFTPDGNGLVARMYQREWLYWDVRPDLRPVDQIVQEAELLHPDRKPVKNAFPTMLSEIERRHLRASDPGPPLKRKDFTEVAPMPRQAGLPARMLDLTRFYDAPLTGFARWGYLGNYRELAPGAHRLLGIDYDVRGIIALASRSFAGQLDPARPPPAAVRDIHPDTSHLAALDILVTGYDCMDPEKGQPPYSIVELAYADGTRARLPLECWGNMLPSKVDEKIAVQVRKVQFGSTDHRPVPPIAWRQTNFGTTFGWDSMIEAVRLLNPHPERAVSSIALEATDLPYSSPLFFAITTEPVETGAATAATNPAQPPRASDRRR